jgi:small-conductance mechanosensitive channel
MGMRVRRWVTAGLLVLLVAATITGLVLTREGVQSATANQPVTGSQPTKPGQGKGTRPRRARVVDTQPLLTAKRMAALATLPEEHTFADQAIRLGNHSVDLAFTDALRRVTENPPPSTPEIKTLAEAKDKAESTVEDDQQLVKELAKKLAAAPEAKKNGLEDQLDVAKAQLELDQDELDEAAADLERAGGDPQARIRRLKAAHEAADKDLQTTAQSAEATSRFANGSLLGRLRTWTEQRNKRALLEQARQEALDTVQRIDGFRTRFSARVKQQAEARQTAKESATGFVKGGAVDPGTSSRDTAKANLASLKHFLADQKMLTDMGKRIEDEQELGNVYGDWAALVETQEETALHRVLESLLVILAVAFGVFLAGLAMEHLFRKAGAEDVRAGTMATVAKFAVEALGALIILFVVIGIPSQTTTILGLAGAGLTVAMKDFIVAFFGWFILMGRNGIRVGDWVEIKGVGGEVVEISLLRTVLLETGSWSDVGHPTGRRVAFVNSFAIEGHFFNFSTSGQWMWDELVLLIPSGQDPYPIIDGIQKLVERETEANSKLAEQEWQKATRKYRVKAFSAIPGLQVVPTSSGIEIHVRYITRAYERHETRRNLNQAVLELMHGKRPEDEGTEASA